jgi:hypothetical protein
MAAEHTQDSPQQSEQEAVLRLRLEEASSKVDDAPAHDAHAGPDSAQAGGDATKHAKKLSEEKVRRRQQLPALGDDADVGIEKRQVVTRDGKADIGFTGVLLASAAAPTAEERWWEYRVYLTTGGKHVFSKVNRTVFEGDDDEYSADVFDPAPSSMPSQLLRSAREITRSKPITWHDAAVAFFGYGPIAKSLYRKLDGSFEEEIA